MTRISKTLLAAGADVHARNRAGYTALHCAMLREEVDDLELCIERLVRAGARVEELTNSGETALALALIAGRGNVAKCLLGFGARMTAEDLRRHARARWIRTQRLWHTEEQALLLRIAKFDARVSSMPGVGAMVAPQSGSHVAGLSYTHAPPSLDVASTLRGSARASTPSATAPAKSGAA